MFIATVELRVLQNTQLDTFKIAEVTVCISYYDFVIDSVTEMNISGSIIRKQEGAQRAICSITPACSQPRVWGCSVAAARAQTSAAEATETSVS